MISLKNIRNTLSEITWSLGLMCKSNKINQWSFRKPINSPSITSLTIDDYYNANDGFMLFTFSTPQRMLYELQHPNASNIWKYEERTEPYRLTDFENYNHYAGPLCILYVVDDNGGTPGSSLRFECHDLMNMIQHWKYFEDVRSYVDLIFLIYKAGTEFDASGMQGLYAYKIASVVDYDGDGTFNFKIPSDFSTGRYEIRLCCAVTDNVLSDGECRYVNLDNPLRGTWYALPRHCMEMFTVNSGEGGGGGGTSTDYYDYLAIDFYDAEYEYNALEINNLSFTNYIVINSATNLTFNLYVEYWYDNAPSPVMLGWASRTLNEDDMPSATINMHYKENITTITEANLDDRIAIRAEYSLTMYGKSYHKTINTTIERVRE